MHLVEEQTVVSDGLRLHVRRWPAPGAAKGTVLVVHGYGEHSGRYGHVAKFLGERGYETWAFDLRGHGRSEGPRAYVGSMDEFLSDVRAVMKLARASAEKRPLFLLGHSLGGCISTLYVLRDRPDITGLVLSGPALKLGEDFSPAKIAAGRFLGKFLPKLPIEKLKHTSISRDPDVVAAYENDPLVYHGWAKTGFGLAFIVAAEEIDKRMEELEVPLFVMAGERDRMVNKEGGKELYRRARSADKRLEVYSGLYHEIFNEPEQATVLGDLGEWLDRLRDAATERHDQPRA